MEAQKERSGRGSALALANHIAPYFGRHYIAHKVPNTPEAAFSSPRQRGAVRSASACEIGCIRARARLACSGPHVLKAPSRFLAA